MLVKQHIDHILFNVLLSRLYMISQLILRASPTRYYLSHFSSEVIEARKWSESHSVMCDSSRPRGLYNPRNSLGKNTGMGSLSFLQQIFPTQELNQGLLHCRWILYQLSYQGCWYWSIKRCITYSRPHSVKKSTDREQDLKGIKCFYRWFGFLK